MRAFIFVFWRVTELYLKGVLEMDKERREEINQALKILQSASDEELEYFENMYAAALERERFSREIKESE
jgi:hypothetical protein